MLLAMLLAMFTNTIKIPKTLSKIYGYFKYLYCNTDYIENHPFFLHRRSVVTFVEIHAPNVTNSN